MKTDQRLSWPKEKREKKIESKGEKEQKKSPIQNAF